MIALPVACVVDASVGIKLVINEALSGEAHALFAHLARDPAARFSVPDLFDLECANVLWKQVQRAGYPLADAQLNLATLTALALQRLPVTALATDSLAIAANYRISAYDASYVAASQRQGVPLITADARLVTRMAGTPYTVLFLGSLTIPPPP
ncbi:MAG TPA: type II toxin-antitoxin system VapC family toxin [Gemmataceae bacterium]|nr:type II toxin-antitoxin system VapC family toxin [Gemmataceae bacterium]